MLLHGHHMPSPWEYKQDTYITAYDERGTPWYGQIDSVFPTYYLVRVGGSAQKVNVPIRRTGPHSSFAKAGEATWGQTHMVSAGVLVELQKTAGWESSTFVAFIRDAIEEIRKVPVGADLLWEFDPRNPERAFRQIDNGLVAGASGSLGMYRGATVVIREPERAGKPIETKAFGGREHGAGSNRFGDPKVPLIRFYNRPPAREVIALKSEAGPVQIDSTGVIQHPDFAELTEFAIVLFHELCHAWYDQIGIFAKLTASNPSTKGIWAKGAGSRVIDAAVHVEEQLVCGLLAGKGVKFSENTYRFQTGKRPRRTYLSVGIMGDDELAAYHWPRDGYTDPAEVLRLNGYPG